MKFYQWLTYDPKLTLKFDPRTENDKKKNSQFLTFSDRKSAMPSATVFIGDLPDRARARDIESFFKRHGKIDQIRLRNRFGFVDFRDRRDAEDAIKHLDGDRLCGERVRLEMADVSYKT